MLQYKTDDIKVVFLKVSTDFHVQVQIMICISGLQLIILFYTYNCYFSICAQLIEEEHVSQLKAAAFTGFWPPAFELPQWN